MIPQIEKLLGFLLQVQYRMSGHVGAAAGGRCVMSVAVGIGT